MRSLFPVAIALSTVLWLGACGDDDDDDDDVDSQTTNDGGGSDGAGGSDSAGADAADPAARGKYLVDHVSLCIDCHTPRNMDGTFDMANYLAGVECFVDTDPMDADVGCLSSRNLTNHATGLMNRTDDEIKDMFQNGIRPNGAFLNNVMPYWVFHNMTDDDANAVVAYLRTVAGVDHTTPAPQPPFDVVPAAALPLDPATDIPQATGGGDSAERGRYLASMAGVCIECHTEHTAPGSPKAIDTTLSFAGGEGFPGAAFGPPGTFPDVIYTKNLTPDPTGIMEYDVADIATLIKMGMDADGNGVCPPMPSGPFGQYIGLTDQDVMDIATYIDNLAPVENAIPNECTAPMM